MNRDDLIEKMARAIYVARHWRECVDSTWRVYAHEAQAQLSAIEAAGVALVPVEMNAAMNSAARDILPFPYVGDRNPYLEVDKVWAAALNASPYRVMEDEK